MQVCEIVGRSFLANGEIGKEVVADGAHVERIGHSATRLRIGRNQGWHLALLCRCQAHCFGRASVASRRSSSRPEACVSACRPSLLKPAETDQNERVGVHEITRATEYRCPGWTHCGRRSSAIGVDGPSRAHNDKAAGDWWLSGWTVAHGCVGVARRIIATSDHECERSTSSGCKAGYPLNTHLSSFVR